MLPAVMQQVVTAPTLAQLKPGQSCKEEKTDGFTVLNLVKTPVSCLLFRPGASKLVSALQHVF